MMKGMIFAERYKLEDFIGQGGMSLVYRAVDIRTGHSVAVKILKSEYNSDKEFLERFQREAQAASLMSHHNLVNLLDVGVEGEYRYLVLEYVNGNTLKDIIRQKGRINYQTSIQVAIRILSALQHAHDNGIIHRDIKPQNVLIHADGHVKVADFGIARMTGGATIGKGDTVVGSVHYSSPEQASGSVVEATSDLYSTGVVMYEMLTGRVPFVGDTPVAVAMQHIQDAPPPITDFAPETPPAVVAVVMKALEKDPKRRFQSAREMAEALQKARMGQLDPASIMPPAEAPRPAQPLQNPSQPPVRVQEVSPAKPAQNRRTGQTTRRTPIRKRSREKWIRVISLLALIAVVLGLLCFGVVYIYQQVSQSVLAPHIVGLPVEDAQQLTDREGLHWQQTDIYHDSIPAGTVISQIPQDDTPMKRGDSLLATVSLGPVNSAMPDVRGLSYEDAAARLTERGLGSVVAMKVVSTSAVGTVLEQIPKAGDPFTPGQSVELTISGGSTMVPELTGYSREEAISLLLESGLSEANATFVQTTDPDQVGMVLGQNPVAGTICALGAPVSLSIGVEKTYQGELALIVPESNHECVLRVALYVDRSEITKYEGTLAAGEQRVMTIPISASVPGEQLCLIYLDGVLYGEEYVTLY